MAEVYFSVPKGFEIPEDKKPGDMLEVLAQVEIEDSGKLCLKSIDGVPVSEGKKPEKGFAEAVEEGYQ